MNAFLWLYLFKKGRKVGREGGREGIRKEGQEGGSEEGKKEGREGAKILFNFWILTFLLAQSRISKLDSVHNLNWYISFSLSFPNSLRTGSSSQKYFLNFQKSLNGFLTAQKNIDSSLCWMIHKAPLTSTPRSIFSHIQFITFEAVKNNI